jgi:hypothetical protein
MEKEKEIPRLLRFLYGEAAEAVQIGASERLKTWARAFDEWIAERRRIYKANTVKQSVLAWRRLMGERRKMPWELSQADIEQHTDWMKAQGYAPTTISNTIGIISNFYRWCDQRQVDPECEAGFNPAAGVTRPKIQRYAGAKLLSREEVKALLGVLKRDETALGKRDYAFTLARLNLGVPLKALQRLEWGQIEEEGGETWVRWHPGAERGRLPGEVWKTIRAYLEASGRWEGMRAGKYIFTPLAEPGKEESGNQAEDWREEKYLSSDQILANLKVYGGLAGIPEDKLTMRALRRTATRMRLDEGESLEGMQAFLDSREERRMTKYRLGKLPELPEDSEEERRDLTAEPPDHKAKPFKLGEGITHGFYAQRQPEQAVYSVLAENIQGVEEEIAGLRSLGRELLNRQMKATSRAEAARLVEAYTQTASRLAELIRAERQLDEMGEKGKRVEELTRRINQMALELGEPPMEDPAWEEAPVGKTEMEVNARRLVEEIAAMRYVLRRTFKMAMETRETPEYVRLVEIYGSGCTRLVRLLRMEGDNYNQMEATFNQQINQAIKEITEDWNLQGEG